MRRALVIILAFAAFAALTAGGTWMWRRRPWRIVATVDGDALTSRDLDLRLKAYCGDRPVTESDRREMVRAWIAKQILLGEAVRRNASLSETDERVVKGVLVAWLASQGTTADDFFAEGPLPEDVKRNDFKEGLLIHALVREVLGKEPFAAFYRPLHEKALVQCPEFPELERPGGEPPLYAGLWGWRPARISIAAAYFSLYGFQELRREPLLLRRFCLCQFLLQPLHGFAVIGRGHPEDLVHACFLVSNILFIGRTASPSGR